MAATISNRMRGKNEQPMEPAAFMPFHRVKQQSPEEMKRTLQTILGQVIKDG